MRDAFFYTTLAHQPRAGGITLTEKVIICFLVLAMAGIIFFSWWVGALFLGAAALLAGTSQTTIPSNPPVMGVMTPFGQPSSTGLIKKPRVVFVYGGFPLYDGIVQVPLGLLNIDLSLKGVACGMADHIDDTAPRSYKSGGKVTFEVSWTGKVAANAEAAFSFVKAGGKDGVKGILDDEVAKEVRPYSARRTWETLVGEMKEIEARLQARIIDRLTQLGLDPGELDVKNIEPEGELAKDSEKAARELQQRRAEKADTETNLALAEEYIQRAKKSGETITLRDALEMVRIDKGRTQEVVTSSKGKGSSPVVFANTQEGGNQ